MLMCLSEATNRLTDRLTLADTVLLYFELVLRSLQDSENTLIGTKWQQAWIIGRYCSSVPTTEAIPTQPNTDSRIFSVNLRELERNYFVKRAIDFLTYHTIGL